MAMRLKVARLAGPLRLASRSLAGKFLALAIIFLVVPLTLYAKFESTDGERQAFLLRSLQVQGRLAARLLEPVLDRTDGKTLLEAAKAVQSLAADQIRIKLLLRPAGRDDSFFLVAASPALDPASLEQERDRLDRTGVLPHLDESCAGDKPLALRYAGSSGHEELLTSISPVHAKAGCWLVITSYATDDLGGSSLARPFSDAPEVKLAMAFYALMAILMGMAVTGTLIDLRAFARLARRIRQGGSSGKDSFAKVAAIPELVPVAREFDRMVATLDASARALRETAEDNAHALKAPIAAITQSLEPLREAAVKDRRAAAALENVEHALVRLGNLINMARRIDEAAAELMKARLSIVDLAALAASMADAYDRVYAPKGVHVLGRIEGPALVAGTEDSLETVIENLLDNAVGFSPVGGSVRLGLSAGAGRVRLTVEDDGPGVPADQLGNIFRRNVSLRPAARSLDGDPQAHFGIGLAVVRRNVELLGGEVHAENLPGAGLKVTILLPAAKM